MMKRIPRKKKKKLKKMFKYRYGVDWLRCENVVVEYRWFFKNPFKFNMNKQIWKW
jgi:hypothetical protein